jgi:hypothetical protein
MILDNWMQPFTEGSVFTGYPTAWISFDVQANKTVPRQGCASGAFGMPN